MDDVELDETLPLDVFVSMAYGTSTAAFLAPPRRRMSPCRPTLYARRAQLGGIFLARDRLSTRMGLSCGAMRSMHTTKSLVRYRIGYLSSPRRPRAPAKEVRSSTLSAQVLVGIAHPHLQKQKVA